MSVPSEKLHNILQLCHQWENKNTCTKQQLQSLLGSFLYISKCVKPARAFLSRMLQFLRDMGDSRPVRLSQEFFKDLAWFKNFVSHFNGIVYYDTRHIQAELHLNACLTGLGGIFDNQCYALPIQRGFNNYSIFHLEMLNIVVALKV